MKRKPVENLTKPQRRATPLPFAMYLVDKVRKAFGVERVACLWVEEASVYHGIEGCDCWPASRDAFTFTGPGPIIAHPPCGPWGKFRWKSKESLDHGIRAMEYVHRFGGVVEHPVGSRLFLEHGLPFVANLERINQGEFGHPSDKATVLYWVFSPEVRP